MIIIHQISDFLFELFPKAKANGKNTDILKEELEKYYTFGVYKPEVKIESDVVQIMIDVPSIINQKPEFDKAVAFCEKRKFGQAKTILEKLIKDNLTVSEYHRVLGQIFSEEGNQDEAINSLIDALKWDPKNGYALIMMGNIFAREKDDIDTAVKYYNEAVVQNPKDHIAINNLGTNLIQIGKWEEGLKLLEKAYDINPNYPNTNYGIGCRIFLKFLKSGQNQKQERKFSMNTNPIWKKKAEKKLRWKPLQIFPPLPKWNLLKTMIEIFISSNTTTSIRQ